MKDSFTMESKNEKRQIKNIKRVFMAGLLAAILIGTACEILNNPPSISISVEDQTPLTGSRQTFTAVTEDLDEDPLRITWSVTSGTLSKDTGDDVQWTAPLDRGSVLVTAVVDDRISSTDTAFIILDVINDAPVINSLSATSNFVLLGNMIDITVIATDPNDEEMTYEFSTSPVGIGTFQPTTEPNRVTWIAPTNDSTPFSREYDIVARVTDDTDFFSTDTLSILVYSEHGTLWIADSWPPRVSKYTERGHFILNSSHNFTTPVAVANNIGEFYGVYVADNGADEVVKLDPLGERITSYPDLPAVIDIAIHRDSRTLWALTLGNASLVVINTLNGEIVKTVIGFSQPEVIEINQNNGDVWISDFGKQIVVQFDANDQTVDEIAQSLPDSITSANTTFFENIFDVPTAIAVANLPSANATVYIADRTQSGGELDRLVWNAGTQIYQAGSTIPGYDSPTQLAVTLTGVVWVANETGVVKHFDEIDNGLFPVTIFSYAFKNPSAMKADPITGAVWIGDSGTNEIINVIMPDSVDVVISGFGRIEDLVVNK